MLSTAVALLALVPAADKPVEADFVIRNVTIHDGTGKPGRKADVAIKGERIVAVGKFRVAGKPRVIGGEGLIASPGFIDLHTHCDMSDAEPGGITLPERRANLNYLKQGVTTVVTGNCGNGFVDVAGYLDKLDRGKVGTNVAHLVPHNAVRRQVMGNANRAPGASELTRMKDLVDRGMRDGAWGMSTGLWYVPGTYARTEEVVALAKVVARHGGIYATHMRDEEEGLLPAVEEALKIGREARVPVHISHLKAGSKKVWGKSADALALIQKARKEGRRVTADQYPYTAWSTSLAATLVPAVYRRGTEKEYVARLDDPEQGPKVRKEILASIKEWDADSTLQVARYAKEPTWQGKTLGQIARKEKKSVLDVVLQIERSGGAAVVGHTMSEEDVRLIMKQPFVATASDGRADLPSDKTVPHPRSYGTFPRKIARYALKDKVVTLEHALRSCTGLPADVLGLRDRGYLRPGYYADVVVFDPKTFRDTATYTRPHRYAPGVRYLFVNGVPAIDDGKYTGALAGKALRHKDKARPPTTPASP
jgi:N-acyl-D-amino-acid deacylase